MQSRPKRTKTKRLSTWRKARSGEALCKRFNDWVKNKTFLITDAKP